MSPLEKGASPHIPQVRKCSHQRAMCLAPVKTDLEQLKVPWEVRSGTSVADFDNIAPTTNDYTMDEELGWWLWCLSTGVKQKKPIETSQSKSSSENACTRKTPSRRAQSRSQVGPSQHCEAACIVQGTILKTNWSKNEQKHQKTNSSRSKWWKWGGQWLDDSLTAKSHKRRRHDLYKAFSLDCLSLA